MNKFSSALTKVFFVFFVFDSFFANAQSTAFGGRYYFENDDVRAIMQDRSGNTYIGGAFTNIKDYVGKGVHIDANGVYDISFPKVNGNIFCVLAIPGGGWYIGGDFSKVGGIARSRLARINADGSLHSFNPTIDNTVRALVLDNSGRLYVGGNFSYVNSVRLTYLCRFTTLGALDNYYPSIVSIVSDNKINSLKIDNSGNLYVGGSFSTVNGFSRNGICKLNSSGTLMSFPQISGNSVSAIALDAGGNVYLGGLFSTIGGVARNYLCKIDNNGLVSTFAPVVNSDVTSLAVDASDNLYVGGNFTSVNGVTRRRLCKFDASGTLSTFNPNLDGAVHGISFDGSNNIYAIGEFNIVGGAQRNYFCKFDNSGNLSGLDLNLDSIGRALAVSSTGSIYGGGEFNSAGIPNIRNGLCKLDATGVLTSFAPTITGLVQTLAIDNSNNLYAGGYFSRVNGRTKYNLCKFDSNGNLASFVSYFDNWVNSIVIDANDNLLVGGSFTEVGSIMSPTQRNKLCEFDRSGNLSSFAPNIQYGDVSDLKIDNAGNLYVAGSFDMVSWNTRSSLCKFDANRNLTSFGHSFIAVAYCLALDNEQNIYVGGKFDIASGLVNSIRKFTSAGAVTSFTPANLNREVYALAVDRSGGVFAGGEFTTVGGNILRDRLCKFDSTGALTPFNPETGYYRVEALLLNDSGTSLKVGGFFPGAYLDFNGLCPSPVTINSTSQILTCANNSISLSAPTASTYLWSNGQSSQNIQVSSAGAYQVTLSYPNGCTSTGSVTVSSNIPPLPSVSVSLNQTVTNVSFPAVITISSFNTSLYSYRLLNFATNAFIANVTSPSIVISYGGVFKIEARSLSSGCVSYSGRIKIVHDPNFGFTIVGVPNPINERTVRPKITYAQEGDSLSGFNANVNVYPNPTSDLLFVKFNFEEEIETHFVLSSQDGRIIYESVKSTAADFFEVDIFEYPSGFYYLRIVNNKASQVIPIQVVRGAN